MPHQTMVSQNPEENQDAIRESGNVHQARSYGSQVLQDSLAFSYFGSEKLYLYSHRLERNHQCM